MITIVVSGGAGTFSANFGDTAKKYESLSIISPDNTPMYDIEVLNPDGHFIVGAAGIIAQKTKIVEPYQLNGICTFTISNAVDDGTYQIRLFEK